MTDLDRWRQIALRHRSPHAKSVGMKAWNEPEVLAAIAEAVAAERAHFNAALQRINRMAEIGEPGICAVATEAIRQTESPTKEPPK